jgi:hypothetical protein
MLDRRRFLGVTAATAAMGVSARRKATAAGLPRPKWTIRALTAGPKHHFFGYYGMPPWNWSGKRLVCLETDFHERMPTVEDRAGVMLIEAADGKLHRIAETRAWNFQQGAMLHWNPLDPENEIIFNDRVDREPAAMVLNVETGRARRLPRHLSAVCRKRGYALSLNYARLQRLRPTVGYPGLEDPSADVLHPDTDGVFLVDLVSGESKLVVSIGEVYRRLVDKSPELKTLPMWINHTLINRTDTRFLFFARAYVVEPKRALASAMFTANLDGSELREVVSFRVGLSHFDWKNDREILATFPYGGKDFKHVLFTDGKDDFRVIGEDFFTGDGHCTFSPDEQWIASDPMNFAIRGRDLLIYNVSAGQGFKLGSFSLAGYLGNPNRCDLHPRWSRDGRAICFDAIDPQSGLRQLHLAEIEFG